MDLEDNGYLNEIYPVVSDLHLSDIFEAAVAQQPEIIIQAVKQARPSVKEVHLLRGEMELSATNEDLEGQGKILVRFWVWMPASERNKTHEGLQPRNGLDISLRSPDGPSSRLYIGFQFVPSLTKQETQAVLGAIASGLAKTFTEFSAGYVKKQIEQKAEPYQKQLDAAQKDLERTLNIALSVGAVGVSPGAIADRLALLDRQLFDVKLSLTGLQARDAALREAIERTGKQQAPAADSEMAANLKKIEQLRTEQLERIRKLADSGQASKQEAEAVEAAMLEAKIAYEQARSVEQRGPVRAKLDVLNDDLSRLVIERQELKAREEFLAHARDEARKELNNAQVDAQRAQQFEGQLRRAQQDLDRASSDRNRIQAANYFIKPMKLSVVDEALKD